MNHPIKKIPAKKTTARAARGKPVPPAWPSFVGTSQYVGTSPSGRVTVFVDPTLGQPGLQNAKDLVNDADRIATANDGIFGTTGSAVSVIVYAIGGATDGTGGADHLGCDYATGNAIEVCASFGNSARVGALFEAELSECSMGGNLCGESTGEALSRWCAAVAGITRYPTSRPRLPGPKTACPTTSIKRSRPTKIPIAPAAAWHSSRG